MAKKHEGGMLAAADLSAKLSTGDYERKLAKLQHRLRQIQQAYLFSGDRAVIVFEGWDAAGKGGTIRRISSALDPRSFNVWPIGAPRPFELERHYLQRFWERLPPRGAMAVFDRSWYGRVLVERVEGFAAPAQWKRAYREINDFERLISEDGARVLKFFLHISAEEQLKRFRVKRFRGRLNDPVKRWKLSYEDFRNRGRRHDYEQAAEEMFGKTSTDIAPWRVVPANDKKFARIDIMKTIADRLAEGVNLEPAPLEQRTLDAAREAFDLDPEFLKKLEREAGGPRE